jgi:hypothetical protein
MDVLQNNFPIMAVDDQNCILYFKQSQWYNCSVFQTNSHDTAYDEYMFLRILWFLLKTELQGGPVFMVTHLFIWRLITMLQFFSRSDSEAVEYNPSFENGCLLRYT